MRYKDMLQEAKAHGVTSEVIMWGSIDDLDDLLCMMKEEHPEEYWKFMRKQHGRLYKNHYDQKFAEYDVSQIHYTDKTGKMHHGAHWTADEVEEATKGMPFASDVTKWDKYVAFNSFYADLCKELSDTDILKAAHAFWFKDEDWDGHGKIWKYYCMK
jgi:hypothetical protein